VNTGGLDLGGVYPQDAQQGLSLALDAPTVQVPANNAGLSLGGGLSLPQTVAATAPPAPGTVVLPTQTVTGTAPPSPVLSAQTARDMAYNQNLARLYQGASQAPNTDATVQALRNAGATPMSSTEAPPAAPGPAVVANPFAAKAAGAGAISPAANVPLANPADIEGIQNAQAGQAAAQQGLSADQIANDESIEKLEGGEAAEAKIKDIDAGIKAKRAEIDAKEHYGRIRSAYDKLAVMSVDPNHYANSLDTGHKIMQTLANVFAGYSAGIHGGPNQAVEDYQRRVQADIDAQKDNISNGYKSIAGQEGLYETMLKATGTPQEAEALALSAHQEALKHALGKVMASTQSREDYDKARTAWYAAAQQQHETAIKYHKYFPAGALGAGVPAPGATKAEDVDSKRATQAIANLERDGEVPGTSWKDRLRHYIGEKTGLGGSVESPEATRFYSAKDALVAAKMKLEQMSRINPENVRDYGKRWQTTEQIDQLRREVAQGISDKEAIPAKGTKGGSPRVSEEEEAPP
jgi:hypothetical protein